MKLSRKNEAKDCNNFHYKIAKELFTEKVFKNFKTLKLYEEDLLTIISFEEAIEKKYETFETEVNRIASESKEWIWHVGNCHQGKIVLLVQECNFF